MKKKRREVTKHSKSHVKDFDPAGILRECKCFNGIIEMIEAGKYTRTIVEFIHDSNELTHISRKALMYKVQRLKDVLLTEVGAVKEEKIVGKNDVDESDPASIGHSLQRIFHQMIKRVDMETETELALNKLFVGTGKEYLIAFKIGAELLKVLKHLDMSEKTGIPGEESHGKIKMDTVMAQAESRHKLLGIVDLIITNPDMFKNVSSLDAARAKKKKKNRPKRNKNIESDQSKKVQ